MLPKTQVTGTEARKIRCDICKVETFVSGGHDDAGTRAIARRSGWQYLDGKDRCPADTVRVLDQIEILELNIVERSIFPGAGFFDAPRTCRVCGCTDDKACLPPGGPCHWVEPDLCSACRPEETC